MNLPKDWPEMYVPGRQAIETLPQAKTRTLGSQAIELSPEAIRSIEVALQRNLQPENQENQS